MNKVHYNIGLFIGKLKFKMSQRLMPVWQKWRLLLRPGNNTISEVQSHGKGHTLTDKSVHISKKNRDMDTFVVLYLSISD